MVGHGLDRSEKRIPGGQTDFFGAFSVCYFFF